MIAILLAAIIAYPGTVLNVSVDGTAVLSVSDACLFFDNLDGALIAEPGIYKLHVGYNCTAGEYEVYANDSTLLKISVNDVNESYLRNAAAELQRENLRLRDEVLQLELLLRDARTKIEELRGKLEKVEREKRMLEVENGLLKDEIGRLSDAVKNLRAELKSKREKIDALSGKIEELSGELQTYRAIAVFLIALFAGSYAAIVYASRKL